MTLASWGTNAEMFESQQGRERSKAIPAHLGGRAHGTPLNQALYSNRHISQGLLGQHQRKTPLRSPAPTMQPTRPCPCLQHTMLRQELVTSLFQRIKHTQKASAVFTHLPCAASSALTAPSAVHACEREEPSRFSRLCPIY